MTTKTKIISGFLLMVMLLAVTTYLSFSAFQKVSNDFTESRRLGMLNSITSDLVAALNLFDGEVYKLLDSKDPKHTTAALEAADEALKYVVQAGSLTHRPARKAALADMGEQIQNLHTLMEGGGANVVEAHSQYTNVVEPNSETLGKKLLEISGLAREIGNIEVTYELARALEKLAHLRSAIGRYAEAREQKDASKISGYLADLHAILDEIGPMLRSEKGRRSYQEIVAAFTPLNDSFKMMSAKYSDVEKGLLTMRDMLRHVNTSARTLSADVNVEAKELAESLLQNNIAVQRQLLSAGGIGLLLGIVCTIIIVMGIIRVLSELSRFARAISKGDFSYAVKVREKGEIGAMIEAMKQIPATLTDMVTEYSRLEQSVTGGALDVQGNAGKFSGEFSTLVQGTNSILKRFVLILNNIPSPLVMLDKDLKACFLNKVAQDLAGSDFHGKTCEELFHREDFGTSSCALTNAVSADRISSGDTVCHPGGKTLDIHYTAVPMHDSQGKFSCVIQFITDLTRIKNAERNMLAVAKESQEIADRIAGASENLASQVEQISLGAEMQRTRVESTASAMTEMNSTVLEVARNASQASEQSEGTRKRAEDGARLVNNVVLSINQVNDVAITLQENMQELGKQAESIGGVMNVISDIADQTNLLALNAAIEAARAGEAGRGFAVVADEVRKLAEKTMHATQEVGSNIRAIQHSAQLNINEVGNAVKNIHDATELSNSSGAALKEIVDLASSNSAVVASIATAAEEQSATSEEISQAIGEINNVVRETTDGITQSSAAVQDLARVAQQLKRVMEKLH